MPGEIIVWSVHFLLAHREHNFKTGLFQQTVSTPYHGYLKNLMLSLFDHWDVHHTSLREGGHIKFWSKRTLLSLLENNGFKALSFYGVGRVPYLWKSMIVVAQKCDSKE